MTIHALDLPQDLVLYLLSFLSRHVVAPIIFSPGFSWVEQGGVLARQQEMLEDMKASAKHRCLNIVVDTYYSFSCPSVPVPVRFDDSAMGAHAYPFRTMPRCSFGEVSRYTMTFGKDSSVRHYFLVHHEVFYILCRRHFFRDDTVRYTIVDRIP